MAFNGSGTFTRNNGTHTGSTVWAQDNAAGTKIVDTIHDTHDQDIATGLSTCITKDGQTTITADLPMATFKHTGVGNGTARTHYTSIGQLQDQGPLWGGTTGGTAAAYTISLTPAITAYAQGQIFRFIAHATNSGTCSLAVNGLTAYQINKNHPTTAIVAGEITINEIVTVVYDTTTAPHFRLVSVSAAATYHNGNVVFTADYVGLMASVATGISAAGTTAADATQLTKAVNLVSTVAANSGVRLSDSYPIGATVLILNTDAADSVKVYPKSSGGTINGTTVITLDPLAVSGKGGILVVQTAASTWYTVG